MRLEDVLTSTDLMNHAVRVTEVQDRRAFFLELARGQRVLHVGCCDVPVFSPETNLHVALARVTDRLDGLDVSEPGIEVLRRHVGGDYFTAPERISKDYDLVLVPEVIEHTRDPETFLRGIFGLCARRYLVTAPSFAWFGEAKRDGAVFLEKVHGDHKAWYSPYTLLNTLRPFIDETADDIEVYVIPAMGSVGVRIDKRRELRPWPSATDTLDPVGMQVRIAELLRNGESGAVMELLRRAYEESGTVDFAYQEIALRLSLNQNLEALRRSVEVMRSHPEQAQLLYFAAEASERLGDPAQAEELRNLARARSGR